MSRRPWCGRDQPWWCGNIEPSKSWRHPESLFDNEAHPEFVPCGIQLNRQLPLVPYPRQDEVCADLPKRRRSSIIYAVALLARDTDRVEYVRTQLDPKIPDLVHFRATDKFDRAEVLAAINSVHNKTIIELPPGKVAWWATYLRFLKCFLYSEYDYAVLLQDDAVVHTHFVQQLSALVTNMSEPMKKFSYRLGPFQTGNLIPREAIARHFGVFCKLKQLAVNCDHFHMRHNRFVGHCPLTAVGTPFNALTTPEPQLSKRSNINQQQQHHHATKTKQQEEHVVLNNNQASSSSSSSFSGLDRHNDPMEIFLPLCQVQYPGKVDHDDLLRVKFSLDNPFLQHHYEDPFSLPT